MRHALRLHPDFRCDAVERIEVSLAWPGPGVLALDYEVTGAIGDLYLPAPISPTRADELWRRTCFEAFVRPRTGEAYVEFNFAPSRAWAAYGFSGYRAGLAALEVV